MKVDKAFYKKFFSMYVALVLQNVITISVNLADNIMLGAYSETALSGVAAVNQIQFVYQQLLFAVGEVLGKKADRSYEKDCFNGDAHSTDYWNYLIYTSKPVSYTGA